MAEEEAGSWHGWSHGEQALYLSPVDDQHIGLYLQVARQTDLVAVFMDPAAAQMVMDFLDGSLLATAAANAELLRRLEQEQPLLFRGPPAQGFIQPEADELLTDDVDS